MNFPWSLFIINSKYLPNVGPISCYAAKGYYNFNCIHTLKLPFILYLCNMGFTIISMQYGLHHYIYAIWASPLYLCNMGFTIISMQYGFTIERMCVYSSVYLNTLHVSLSFNTFFEVSLHQYYECINLLDRTINFIFTFLFKVELIREISKRCSIAVKVVWKTVKRYFISWFGCPV